MKLSVIVCGLLASLSSVVSATALTYKLVANEKACFFASVENKGAKIAFYFAVSPLSPAIFSCTDNDRFNLVGLSMSITRLWDRMSG